MPNGGDEGNKAAITIAQQDRLFIKIHGLEASGDLIGDSVQASAHKVRVIKTRKAQNDDAVGSGKSWCNQVEAALVSQQRMEQDDRRTAAGSSGTQTFTVDRDADRFKF